MKKICITYFSAGAGHVATSEAIYNELKKYDDVELDYVDFITEYKIPIFQNSSKSYGFLLSNMPDLQWFIVKLFCLKFPLFVLLTIFKILIYRHIDRFIEEHPADIYVSTGFYDHVLFDLVKKKRPKVKTIVIVTDIVFANRTWFSGNRDLLILPTQEIYDNGYKYFKNYQNKVKVLGLPIREEFFKNKKQIEYRRELNLKDQPTIFISGGGEGLPIVEDIVLSIDNTFRNSNIIAICGKHSEVKYSLERKKFKNDVTLISYTDKFSEYLLASDVIITKGGPTTIWETMTANKKMIIYSYIKGQEAGNVDFAKKYANAVFEKKPKKIAKLAKELIQSKPIINNNRYTKNWTKEIVKLIRSF